MHLWVTNCLRNVELPFKVITYSYIGNLSKVMGLTLVSYKSCETSKSSNLEVLIEDFVHKK